jgi:Methyltransferase domain
MSVLRSFIDPFSNKLQSVQVSSISSEQYPVEYLRMLMNKHQYYIRIYAHVLEKLLQYAEHSKEEMIVVDYGAGNGLLGLFEKFCGFKKVYLSDTSSAFLHAAQNLARNVNTLPDGFIDGDIQSVQKFFEGKNHPNAIVGTDVIEHIYDLDEFFSTIKQMNADILTVFTTGLVTGNPIKANRLKKIQYQDEFLGSNPEYLPYHNDYSGLSFFEIRKKIIRKHFSNFSHAEIEMLATRTTGLIHDDILKAIEIYFATGELPAQPSGYNTVDPITGSWTERLLQPKEYECIYGNAGFDLKISNGFYN